MATKPFGTQIPSSQCAGLKRSMWSGMGEGAVLYQFKERAFAHLSSMPSGECQVSLAFIPSG